MGNWGKILRNQSMASIIMGAVFYFALLVAGAYYDRKLIAIVSVCLHIYASIETIKPNQWGAMLLLGSAPLRKVDSVPVFVFFPFFSVRKDPKTLFQVIVGTPLTDKKGEVFKVGTEGENVLREEEPFRVTFPRIEDIPTPEELGKIPSDNFPPELTLPVADDEMRKRFKNQPLHRTLTCDPQFVFWFDIKDYMDFIQVFDDVQTMAHDITSVAKAALQEYAGRMTVGMLMAYNKLVCDRITFRVEQLIGEPHAQVGRQPNRYWGINFRGMQIPSIGLPQTLNESMRNAAAEEFNKDKVVIAAEGEKTKRTKEGEGSAAAARALAEVATEEGGMIVLQLKAITEAIKEGNVTIIPANMADISALLTAGKALIGSPLPPSPPRKP